MSEQTFNSADEMQNKKDYKSFVVLEDIQRSPEADFQEYFQKLKTAKESMSKIDLAIHSTSLRDGSQQTHKLCEQTVRSKKVQCKHFHVIGIKLSSYL